MIYLGPRLGHRRALGRSARRLGLVSGLRGAGVEVREHELVSRWPSLPTCLQLLPAWREIAEHLRSAPDGCTVVMEGADVAVAAAVATALQRRAPVHVHVDVCDSVRLLVDIAPRRGLPGRMRRTAKAFLAGLTLRAVRFVADSVSYISERDRLADAGMSTGASCVVGMGRDPASSVQRDPDGPFVVVGDWGYPPNQEMLARTVAWLALDNPSDSELLRVVGPNLEDEPRPAWVVTTGWVDDLATAYQGTSCALALLSSGAGVKNKVLDAVMHGLPVVGTAEALNGLPSTPMTREWDASLTPDVVRAWARSLNHAAAEVALPPWADLLSELAQQIRLREVPPTCDSS